MSILVASDHAGFEYKQALVAFLRDHLHKEVEDMGPLLYDADDDYPDFVIPLAKKISEGEAVFGIVLCMTGEGETMVANRFSGVRCAHYYGGSLDIVKLSREHNDANVLALGAKFLSLDETQEAISLWLDTPFSGDERHVRRIKKFDTLGES